MRASAKKSTVICVVGLVLGLSCVLLCLLQRPSDLDLFRRSVDPDISTEKQRHWATLLGMRPNADALIIARLDVYKELRHSDKSPFDHKMRAFDAAVIAALLESIQTNVSNDVLTATVDLLDDDTRGRYSIDSLSGTKGDCATDPLQQLARDVLLRTLSTDQGFDKAAWRDEIAKHKTAKEAEPVSVAK
jgi:hypothetical protein